MKLKKICAVLLAGTCIASAFFSTAEVKAAEEEPEIILEDSQTEENDSSGNQLPVIPDSEYINQEPELEIQSSEDTIRSEDSSSRNELQGSSPSNISSQSEDSEEIIIESSADSLITEELNSLSDSDMEEDKAGTLNEKNSELKEASEKEIAKDNNYQVEENTRLETSRNNNNSEESENNNIDNSNINSDKNGEDKQVSDKEKTFSFYSSTRTVHHCENLKAESYGRYKVKLSWKTDADNPQAVYSVFVRRNGKVHFLGQTQSSVFIDTKAITSSNNEYCVVYPLYYYGLMIPSPYYTPLDLTNYTPKEFPVSAKGTVPAVSSVKSIPKAEGAYISWSSSRDAQGYLIYGKRNGSSNDIRIADVTGGKRCYTDSKASNTIKSSYRVIPYFKDSNGNKVLGKSSNYISSYKKSQTLVSNMKAESYGRYKVKLTWNKVAGAKRYIVMAKRNGVIREVGKTTNNVMIDQKAITSDNNFYWVYAVKNDFETVAVNSKDKYVWAKGNVPAVSGLKSQIKFEGAYISWNSSRDAQGYLIYGMRNGSKKDVRIADVTGGKRCYTDTNASMISYSKYRVIPYFVDSQGNKVLGKASGYISTRKKHYKEYTYAEKKKRLSNAQSLKASGIDGFYRSTTKAMAANATKYLNSSVVYGFDQYFNSVNIKPKTSLGANSDATSIANTLKALDQIDECNKIRKKLGLKELRVQYDLMAAAAIQVNYSRYTLNHSLAFSIAENLAWGMNDPFTYWYDKEKALYDEGNRNFSDVGHYLNIINPYFTITGFAVNQNGKNGVTYSQVFLGGNDSSVTTATVRSDLQKYLNDLNKELREAEYAVKNHK